MAIKILTGRPRSGKGLVSAAIAEYWMERKRTVVADYFLEGALPWIDFSHMASPHYAGCLFIADEVGATFGARDTMLLDPLVFAAATMHGHVGADLILQAQSIMFVDIQFRRLAEAVGVVCRFGPDGHYSVRDILDGEPNRIVNGKIKSTKVLWWRRPWFFRVTWYRTTDFGIDGELKATAKPDKTEWFMWTRKRARMYNTQQLVIPEALEESFDRMIGDSQHARRLPPMSKGRILAPGQLHGVRAPVLVDRDGNPRKEQPSLQDIMEARGFYTDGDNHLRDSLSTNHLLQPPTPDGTLKKVGVRPTINPDIEVEYHVQKEEGTGNGNGHSNGNGKSGTGEQHGIAWTNVTPRKPRASGIPKEADSDCEPTSVALECLPENPC